MAAIEFHNYPTVTLVATTALAAAADGTVVEMIKVKKGFRVVRVEVAFDDLGTDTTLDVGDLTKADRYVDGQDTDPAGVVTWAPADSAGYLYTEDDVITIKQLSAAGTGDVRVEVTGYFDYTA